MHAEIEPEQQAEEGEPAPCVRLIGFLPPPQHRPQDQSREHRRQDIRRELDAVLPQRIAEGERECAEPPASDRCESEIRYTVGWSKHPEREEDYEPAGSSSLRPDN